MPDDVPAQPAARRRATDAERRALASSLRLRILRMALDAPLTNKQIAARLGRDPATVLHHVRTLVDTGFLVAEPVRRGARGSRERPYRATRLSWELDTGDDDLTGAAAMVDAFVEELHAAGGETAAVARLGLRLTDAERDELAARLQAVLDDAASRPPSPEGRPLSVFLAIHRDAGRD